MVASWFETNAVLPTVEQGLRRLALGRLLVGAAHDVEGNERLELLREVVVGICELGRLMRQDQYLANDILC